jgi:enoyl-CoA hydratase
VYTITLNRPEAGNSVSLAMIGELSAALGTVEQADDAVALVIAGAGERFFCTGGDVKEYAAIATPADVQAQFGQMRRFCQRLEALPVPVIMAIVGMAVGGGVELALAADLRIARAGVVLRLPQVRLGVVTGWGAHARLVRTIGEARALDLLLTARAVTAEEALTLGLVHRVVPNARDAAAELANDFRKASPAALAAMKAAIRGVQPSDPRPTAEVEQQFLALWFAADHREAERAFAEGRAPRFRARTAPSEERGESA